MLYVFIYIFATLCVCVRRHIRAFYLFLQFFLLLFGSVFFSLILILDYIYIGGALHTMNRPRNLSVCVCVRCSCIAGKVRLKDWLCAYFAFSHSDIYAMQSRSERVASHVGIAANVHWYICCLFHILVSVQCPKPAKNSRIYSLKWHPMGHLWMSAVDSICGIRN